MIERLIEAANGIFAPSGSLYYCIVTLIHLGTINEGIQ